MKKCAAYYIVLFFILIQNSYAQFIDFTNESGVFFIGNNSMWGNGISAIDFNLDGFDDLTIGSDIGIACYQSNGDGSFEMVHFIYLNTHVLQVLWVDYDNDFDLDLFATSYGDGIFLYERTEGLEFTDRSYLFSQYSDMHAYGASWGDYDKDGWKDVFVCQYEYGVGYPDYPNLLFHNNQGNSFQEVGQSMGVASWVNNSFQSVWTDFDNDGWVDLYVINDHDAGNEYYKNVNGLMFENQSYNGSGLIGSCMSNSISDYDRDGDFDIFVSNSGPQYLLENNLNGFEEISTQTNAYMYTFGWGGLWVDYNLDGWEDLYVCNDETWTPSNANFFLVSQQGQSFEQMNFDPYEHKTYSIVEGDFNNDLEPDMAILNGFPGSINVWINEPDTNTHALKIILHGQASDHFGVGAKIHTYYNGEYSLHQVLAGENYISQNANGLIIGIGESQIADSLIVEWPSGWIDRYYGLSSNNTHTLAEGESFEVVIVSSSQFHLCPQGSTFLNVHCNNLSGSNTYHWSNETDDASAIYTDAGSHWIVVSNSFGLVDTIHFNLIPWDLPNIQLNVSPTLCPHSPNGSCLILSDDITILNSNLFTGSLLIDSLLPGDYELDVIDIHGCPRDVAFSISSPAPIEALEDTLFKCILDPIPSDLDVVGGTAPYLTTWVNDTTASGSNQFIVYITDSHGCADSVQLQLINHPELQVFITTDTICDNQLGAFDISLLDSTTVLSSYAVSPIDASQLPPGWYTLNATDQFGCLSQHEFVIHAFPQMEIDIIDTLINGELALYAGISGGQSPYEYSWNGIENDAYFFPEESDEVTLVITDANGCSADTSEEFTTSISVRENPLFVYPNPFSDRLTIQNHDTAEISIRNSIGQLMCSPISTIGTLVLSTNQWPSGVYFLHSRNAVIPILKK